MTVISSAKDPVALTMTFVAEFDADADSVWQLWANPRKLERWWGPPTWPATFERHDFYAGGEVRYYMTGPDGEKARGWWLIVALDAPRSLDLEDGFAGEDGEPDPSMPTSRMDMTLEPAGSAGTRMTILSRFASAEQLEQVAAMGMEEGMRQAMGQMNAILAEGR